MWACVGCRGGKKQQAPIRNQPTSSDSSGPEPSDSLAANYGSGMASVATTAFPAQTHPRHTRVFLYTSESVSEGHPDKLCDQIADRVLDACLRQDPNSKVACEVCACTNFVMIFGEITTTARVDYAQVARDAIQRIGYDSEAKGLDFRTVEICVKIVPQSPQIAAGVHLNRQRPEDIGAGDQGHVFGYACDETEELMPLSHSLANRLSARVSVVRHQGICKWMRPDAKTQVTIEYGETGKHIEPRRVHTILVSCQHDPATNQGQIYRDVLEHVITPVVPPNLMDPQTKIVINPSGQFDIGGPCGDSGLTGRKIIVDTYGGWGSHGGGAFSGKDATKVDRSGAYMARHVAKSLVANKFCSRCLVQVSYAIARVQPLSLMVNSFGTSEISGTTDAQLEQIITRNFDFRPGKIIEYLDLKQPVFARTACYGHFGREAFTWEKIKDLSHERPKADDSPGSITRIARPQLELTAAKSVKTATTTAVI